MFKIIVQRERSGDTYMNLVGGFELQEQAEATVKILEQHVQSSTKYRIVNVEHEIAMRTILLFLCKLFTFKHDEQWQLAIIQSLREGE